MKRTRRKGEVSITRASCRTFGLVGALLLASCRPGAESARSEPSSSPPSFIAVQPDLFSADGAQTNAWADFDGDRDLDLFVGFRGRPNRLYRNDGGVFVDIAAEVGLADPEETRASAWGDYDLDGDPDLYVGFAALGIPNRLYRNDDGRFTDVAAEVGVAIGATTRQPAFVDYDGDGDLDLFVAFRDRANTLFRNDGGVFTDVTEASGIGDPRRTVGVAWFDMDDDGDLDAFVANQNGDEDGFFQNRGDGTFVDVAPDLDMHQPGRAEELGSVGTAVADYDNDGDLDLFVPSYGPDVLWQNQGDGTFVNVAPRTPLAADHHSVSAAWGDYDNDGWIDLYVDTFLADEAEAPDHLFRNTPNGFVDVTPAEMTERGASHGVAWADFDQDGDVDLALANNHADGAHPLYQNRLDSAAAGRSLQVVVVDAAGRSTRAGAVVTLGAGGWYATSRIVDTGGGYSSQGLAPVHFGLPEGATPIEVVVSWFEGGQRRSRVLRDVDPEDFRGRPLVIAVGG